MAGGSAWWRRVGARTRTLRNLVLDTQRALHDVCDMLQFDPDVPDTVQEIYNLSLRTTALVVLGSTPSARARLLHCLLGRQLLPDPPPRGCRWIRISYGSTTQVHLTLGDSDFMLVEELECNKKPWDTLPVEDLVRQDNADLSKILEVEINNQFLKDGLRIIIPPDLDSETGSTDHLTLKKIYSDLYSKRDAILKTVNPIYLYGVDRMGKNIFNDHITNTLMISRSEEDFWSTFNLYSMMKVDDDKGDKCEVVMEKEGKGRREPAVFNGENCLDLHQLKEINPNAQVLFALFSDSVAMETDEGASEERVRISTDSTESSEGNKPESDQGLIQDGLLRHPGDPPELRKRDGRRLYEEQVAFLNELLDQWECMSTPPQKHQAKSQWVIVNDREMMRSAELKYSHADKEKDGEKTIKSRSLLLNTVVKFAYDCLQGYLFEYCTRLSEVHVKLLQQIILASFDMARELQVVPKKIQYVARQEQQLYETINEKFTEGDKKQELLQIMQEVLQEMRSEVNNMDWSVDDLPWHQDRRFVISNSVFYSRSGASPAAPAAARRVPEGGAGVVAGAEGARDASDGEDALGSEACNIDDYDIIADNDDSLLESYPNSRPDDDLISFPYNDIHVENESGSFSLSSGTLWGASGATAGTCSTVGSGMTSCTNSVNISVKQASLDVQQTVLSKLSRKISLRLVKFVDCLKDTYFGTLQRCLLSLEASCREELGGRPASEAMRQLVCVARAVDLAPCASFSLLRTLLDSLRRLLHRLRIVGGEAEEACCVLSPVWRRQVALHTTQSLSPQRLARVISAQILERLSEAHGRYQAALWRLQTAVGARLLHTEDNKLALRKHHAPALARLCLESTSLADLLQHGVPDLGREIGRGQYGVVYSVRGEWAGMSPVAVKSVLPADERHYHELAMEFFYTKSIPAHPRIVRLYGSIVQRHSGSGPSVLLVSERKCRDLHAAVRAGLSFAARMRISCDIVEGIRYLHSLGLVHRDVKMKNVLLDARGRAALSDLGFCAAEALISGSVVGTPVHMAPELFAGDYDAAVDVYAFGILFWYVCAGNIRLPSAFETFQNKEQLWSKVKRGLRPERLPHFTDECWEVMESCWASEPSQRALLGDVQPKLERILQAALAEEQEKTQVYDANREYDYSDDDSLYMTGINKNCL